MTASTSSSVGMALEEAVAVEDAAVLGLPSDLVPDDGEVESDDVLGEED